MRWGWSPRLPFWAHAAALATYTAAIAFAIRAMIVNRFFAPVVRIQSERGHETITAGPYRFVRHPGYAGMLLGVVAESFVFGSLWALMPAAALAAIVAWRTAREDRMLRAQLAGYADYATRVRYRLVPAVW
jgi:protein-S-isoprenylcysteine O-methyltransferase Ste14